MTLFELMVEAKRVAAATLEAGTGESALSSSEQEVRALAGQFLVNTRAVDMDIASTFTMLGVANGVEAATAVRDQGKLPRWPHSAG